MEGLANRLRKNPFWLDAVLVMAVAALAYLPLAGSLGYYHDDWFPTLARVSGASLIQMHRVDRPLMGVLYELVNRLLGEAPLGWHLFAFAARLAGGWALLWLMRLLWPQQRLAGLSVVALFLVYPGFLLQPSANNYQNHFIALALALLSLAFTVRSLQQRGTRRVILILLAALLALIYPNIYEGLIGLEGLRVILIYYELSKRPAASTQGALRRVVAFWLPYLATMAAFGAWRFLIFRGARSSTDSAALIQMYRASPVHMLARLIFDTGRDFLETALLGWFTPAYRVISQATFADLFISLLLGAAAVALFGFGWKRLSQMEGESGPFDWGRDAVRIGGLGLLLTLLPVILSNRDVQFSYNLDRYTLQSIFPAALLVTGLVFYAFRAQARWWSLALLLCLSVAVQYNNDAYYRDFWQTTRQFWWQLTWRAPALKDGTALVAVMPSDYGLAEGFEVWGPANRIYHPGQQTIAIGGSILSPGVARQIAHGQSFGVTNRTIGYTVDTKNTLIASLAGGACLHVVDGNRVELAENETALVRQAARFSRVDMIQADAPLAIPPMSIFGREPAHGWCYYYQKAELARQRKDWEEVARLGDEATRLALQPADVSEWMPFYEAYARLGQIEAANAMASAIRRNDAVRRDLCDQYDPGQSFHPIQPDDKLSEFMISNLCGR